MSLEERLLSDQIEATRSKERFKLSVIRMLRAELHNAAIARRAPLEPGEEIAVLSREVKRRQDVRADYEKAGRRDLLENLDREVAILKRYMPVQLTGAELAEVVRQAVAEAGAVSKKDFGRVMGLVMPRVKGKADGNAVRRAVEQILE